MGPQTLSLLMVPTSSPFADFGGAPGQDASPEEDFYLHLNLPPELDLPLPATTQIYHQPPRSYLIPRWDLGPESGAFTRIEFPSLGKGSGRVTQEDIDTFETILAQCTAFLERAQAPDVDGKDAYKEYNPADFKEGEAYVRGTASIHHGEIVLVNEDDGSVVGELLDEVTVVEDSQVQPGLKGFVKTFPQKKSASTNYRIFSADPVEIEVSADGRRIEVRPMSEDYLRMSRHPAYRDSSLVQNAAAASRLIVTGSSYLSNLMTTGAEQFANKTKPASEPLTFTPSTHARVRKINNFTAGAASLSSKTIGSATKYAQNLGATLARKGERKSKLDNDGYRPGFLNKSMIAFSTIADGIAYSGKHLLNASGAAATHIVGHRYGEDARQVAAELAGGVKNVGLVYIDVTGVSRRAVIKSVAKGMVVGRVKGGGEIVVGDGDGGDVPDNLGTVNGAGSVPSEGFAPAAPGAHPGVGAFGAQQQPHAYSSGAGEAFGRQSALDDDGSEKLGKVPW